MKTDPTTRHPVRGALRHAGFRRLLAALAVSQVGDWLYNLALVAVVLDRTHSSAWVAVTTAARVAPILLAGPVGGVLADRWDRRRLMVASDVARMACMLALAAVAASPSMPVVLAPVLAAVATFAAGPYPSCVASVTPRLVPDEVLGGANAARVAVGTLGIVAGPGLGALLLLMGSPTAAFVVNAGTFAVSAALVLSLPSSALVAPTRDPAQLFDVWSEIRGGATALRDRPEALRLVGADVMCSVVYGAHTVLLLLLARHLGTGSAGYGYLLVAAGAGGVLGTVVASRVAVPRHQLAILVPACVTVAVPAMLLSTSTGLVTALVWATLVGLGSTVVEVATDTALQRCLPPDVLARAYGLTFPAAVAGIVAGSLIAAPRVALTGLRGALLGVGLMMTGYVALTITAGRRGARVDAHTARVEPVVDL